ncbi:hypothetical protein GJAV_G00234090 [Gymnothorax javanicus]|nr:hypothetical protein GJAV_G00234090 [Gymnothorax javanicus]
MVTQNIAADEGTPPGFGNLPRGFKIKFPDADVSGSVGRTSSFEVTVDKRLVYSKLQNGRFPDNAKVVEIVRQASSGGPVTSYPDTKTPKKKSSCVLL